VSSTKLVVYPRFVQPKEHIVDAQKEALKDEKP
jgi:hypothetical protein